MMDITDAEKLARAVLLFFRGGPWSADDRELWRSYTGSDDATTKALCDFARKIRSESEMIEHREHYANVWPDGFPMTPLESWYVMRGYAVKPAAPLDRATFARLPGDLERADGYVMLRQR